MVSIRKWIRSTLGFSRTETNGLIILLPLIVLMLFSGPVYKWIMLSQPLDLRADEAELQKLVTKWEEEDQRDQDDRIEPGGIKKPVGGTLFSFNPNTASSEELQRLGFSVNLSTRIANYRKKGGQFRVKDDLRKIYGMDSAFFERVYTFIALPEKISVDGKYSATQRSFNVVPEKKSVERFDLNLADTTALKAVYGIGGKLALRIVRYRNRLGGFVHHDQLNEVYGLDSTVVKRLQDISFVDGNFTPNLLNINTLTEVELSNHPYISKAMANAIVAYRFQHGNFRHTGDLGNVRLLRKEDIERITPYLQRIEP